MQLAQSVPTIALSDAVLVGVLSIVLNAFIQWLIGHNNRIKLETSLSNTVATNTKDISDLKDSRSEMWGTINTHAVEIGKLQVQTNMKSKGFHG